jgi:hypothetical protein
MHEKNQNAPPYTRNCALGIIDICLQEEPDEHVSTDRESGRGIIDPFISIHLFESSFRHTK